MLVFLLLLGVCITQVCIKRFVCVSSDVHIWIIPGFCSFPQRYIVWESRGRRAVCNSLLYLQFWTYWCAKVNADYMFKWFIYANIYSVKMDDDAGWEIAALANVTGLTRIRVPRLAARQNLFHAIIVVPKSTINGEKLVKALTKRSVIHYRYVSNNCSFCIRLLARFLVSEILMELIRNYTPMSPLAVSFIHSWATLKFLIGCFFAVEGGGVLNIDWYRLLYGQNIQVCYSMLGFGKYVLNVRFQIWLVFAAVFSIPTIPSFWYRLMLTRQYPIRPLRLRGAPWVD